MRIMINLFFIFMVTILLSACTNQQMINSSYSSSLPNTFSSKNIMKVHQGMSADEILTLFGQPKDVDVSICYRVPEQSTCTTWKYGEIPHGHASFTFSGDHNNLILKQFFIERD